MYYLKDVNRFEMEAVSNFNFNPELSLDFVMTPADDFYSIFLQ